uniref:Uncharacterized protein n=1 Tax=Amphimedon queenslandica TaxID=400682 RepID=A0A1X7TNW9_AMPQE
MIMSSLHLKSLPTQILCEGGNGIMFITLLLESYLAVQQYHCQIKEFLIVLLMSLVMGTVYFMPFHISFTGSISQHYDLRTAIVSNMPNFEELFNSTLSATRYSSIYDYINKSKMYKIVWATDTKIISLTALLGITIYSYSLTPTFVGWARYGTQEL